MLTLLLLYIINYTKNGREKVLNQQPREHTSISLPCISILQYCHELWAQVINLNDLFRFAVTYIIYIALADSVGRGHLNL